MVWLLPGRVPDLTNSRSRPERLSLSGAETLHDVAIRALSSIPGFDQEKFEALSSLIAQGKSREAAVEALREISADDWPDSQLRPLADNLVGFLSEMPARLRTGFRCYRRDRADQRVGRPTARRRRRRAPRSPGESGHSRDCDWHCFASYDLRQGTNCRPSGANRWSFDSAIPTRCRITLPSCNRDLCKKSANWARRRARMPMRWNAITSPRRTRCCWPASCCNRAKTSRLASMFRPSQESILTFVLTPVTGDGCSVPCTWSKTWRNTSPIPRLTWPATNWRSKTTY